MTREIKVGLFVIAGLALGMIGVFLIGNTKQLWEQKVGYRIGFVAAVQADMKRLIAYSSISHMGFVIKSDKGWMVRHASTGPEHAVIDSPFGEYVAKMVSLKKWRVAGFALAMPVDASLRVSQIAKSAAN